MTTAAASKERMRWRPYTESISRLETELDEVIAQIDIQEECLRDGVREKNIAITKRQPLRFSHALASIKSAEARLSVLRSRKRSIEGKILRRKLFARIVTSLLG